MKHFNIEDIPEEALWAMIVGCQPDGDGGWIQLVSSETSKKIEEVHKKYPEWFPWETLYNSIPEEVHEAYRREAHPYLYESFDVELLNKNSNTNHQVNEITVYPKEITFQDLVDMIKDSQDREEDRKKQMEIQRKKDKMLWDKHYKKYGLKFRG